MKSNLTQHISTHDTRLVLENFLQGYAPRNFAIRLWDGNALDWSREGTKEFTLVLNCPASMRHLFSSRNLLDIGEAYLRKEFDIEGSLVEALKIADYLLNRRLETVEKLKFANHFVKSLFSDASLFQRIKFLAPANRNQKSRVKEAVNSHYDLPLEFWKLWLDDLLQYTCAYYELPTESIHIAQAKKVDYICRKLDLREGERFVEFGCGWGGILLHAVKHYGVYGVGITLSHKQADYTRKRLRDLGIEKRCRVEVVDFRDFKDDQPFDKAAGVGIIEHLGRSMHVPYFQSTFKLLKPGGLFLNQGITCSVCTPERGGGAFLDKYIFPDHEIVPLHFTLTVAEKAGFEIRDVESLREHYTLTLKAWLQELESHAVQISELVSETKFRAFRIYLAGMAHSFEQGGLNLYHILFSKPGGGPSTLPLTRDRWYSHKG